MITSIEDHMALACGCGSVRFCLLKSGGIECAGCQEKTPHTWEEGERCGNCYGKGWNDESKRVYGDHYQIFKIDCDHCNGSGYINNEVIGGNGIQDAEWFALLMNAAAELEDAANCLIDPDAKRAAQGAAKHYREAAKKKSNAA